MTLRGSPSAGESRLRIVAITDRTIASAETTLARFEELGVLARPRTVAFQLRDLTLPGRERLAFGAAIQRIAKATSQMFLVNDRLDLAWLLGADGVHLGETAVEAADARRLLGERCFVSRALHDSARAPEHEADALLLSPIFEPRKGRPALGVGSFEVARARLRECGRSTLLLALGGVTAARASECLAAGADGVALIGAALRGEGPELVRALDIAR